MATFDLIAGPKTVCWGFYDSKVPPVLSIASGDRLRVGTEPGVRALQPAWEARASKNLLAIAAECRRDLGGHVLNGPVAVAGARPGDVLEVRILEAAPRYDWGFNVFRPLAGGLPEDFPYHRSVVIEIDRAKGVGKWPGGVEVPLAPFFGNLGVAPPAGMGRVPSSPPGVWGGNIDNKELTAGSTLYLPVFHDGALFSVGDGHACQGDGESCLSALETGLEGTLELRVRKDMKIEVPRAETPTHHILMGFDPILDNAAQMALREAIRFLGERRGMSRDDAYTLCSLAVDLHVTQIVNGVKGVHAMIPKEIVP